MSVRIPLVPVLVLIAAALPAAEPTPASAPVAEAPAVAPAPAPAPVIPAAAPELKIVPTLMLQTRGDIADGRKAAGGDYAPGTEGTDEGDDVDFYMRRARLGVTASYGTLTGMMVVSGDNLGRSDSTAANTDSRIYSAWAKYGIKGDGITQELRAGFYQAIQNPSAYYSSGVHLLPASAATEWTLANRNVGAGYSLTAGVVEVHADLMNSASDGTDGQNNGGLNSDPEGDGVWFSTRVQATLPGELAIGKWQESFCGAAGRGAALGLEYAQNDERATGSDVFTTAFGVDLLVHLDGLSALAEFRTQEVDTATDAGGDSDRDTSVWRVQAGYAFPVGKYVLEPALRYQDIDTDTGTYQTPVYGANRDYGDSGIEIDAGANLYLAGPRHKISALYTFWDAEHGEGRAQILRVQHQISF
ncbi:MAG: Phosphate-selective porin [Planctomycetota bacterium]